MIAVALAAMALGGDPSVQPWPIGLGPRYRPRPTPVAVSRGRPIGALRCSAAGRFAQLHLELFADRKVVVVSAGIGVAEPSTRAGADVVPGGCSYPVRTRTPTGIVEFAQGTRLRLADLFRIWGQPLGERRFASFRTATRLRAYVGGRLVAGPAGEIPLTAHLQIVLELGPYVPPHASYLFAGAVP